MNKSQLKGPFPYVSLFPGEKMRCVLLFLSVLIYGSACGQDATAIRKAVEQINRAGNYTVKTVPNEYFAGKGRVTDNGIEIRGFYRSGELKKMEYSVGLSAWNYLTEYFFDRSRLVFVHLKKYRISGEKGYLKKPVLISESRRYYGNRKLIKTVGKSDKDQGSTDDFRQAAELKKDLEDYP